MRLAASTLRQGAAPGLAVAQPFRELWQVVKKSLRDPYRPERHYMRGPGPKWREKHPFSVSDRDA